MQLDTKKEHIDTSSSAIDDQFDALGPDDAANTDDGKDDDTLPEDEDDDDEFEDDDDSDDEAKDENENA
jgi:hypothetical protein